MELLGFGEMFNKGLKLVSARILPVFAVRVVAVFVGMGIGAVGVRSLAGSLSETSGVEVNADNLQQVLQELTPDMIVGALANPVLWLAIVVNLVIFLWAQAGVLRALYPHNEGAGGEPPNSLVAVLLGSFGLMAPLFIVDLFYTVVVALGLVLLLLPGIWLATRFAFAPWLVLVEKTSAYAAMGRSAELVKGHWWAVFGRLFVVGLTGFAATFILSFIPVAGRIVGSLIVPPFLNACQLAVLESLKTASSEAPAAEV